MVQILRSVDSPALRAPIGFPTLRQNDKRIQGLAALYSPAFGPTHNLLRTGDLTQGSDPPTRVINKHGPAWKFSGSGANSYLSVATRAWFDNEQESNSLLVVFSSTYGAGNGEIVLFKASAASSSNGCLVFIYNGQIYACGTDSGGNNKHNSMHSVQNINDGLPHAMCFSFNRLNASPCGMATDGVDVTTTSTGLWGYAASPTNPDFYFGNASDAWWSKFSGTISLVGFWNRQLTSAERISLSAAPWSIFA